MKKLCQVVAVAVIAFAISTFPGCNPPDGDRACFTGTVVNHKKQPIAGVQIFVGGMEKQAGTSSEDGKFEICIKKQDRYVLNFEKLGYGMASKVFSEPVAESEVSMTEATVVEVDPTETPAPEPAPEPGDPAPAPDPAEETVTIIDVTPDYSEPVSANVDNITTPLDTIPFVMDASGNLISFRAPKEIGAVYDAAANFEIPTVGATVQLDPDNLEETDETATAGFFSMQNREKITASISTVDIYSNDGMPGDYTVRLPDNSMGTMDTYGAVDVSFYRNGRKMELKKGKFAIITIPIDTLVTLAKLDLKPTIPLLVYDKDKGEWRRDGNNVGILNKKKTAYVARVSHFSLFNMDEDMSMNPACYKICRDPALVPDKAQIEVSVPGHVKPFFGFDEGWVGPCAGCSGGLMAHAIVRMKPNSSVGIRLRQDPAIDATLNVRSTFVFIAGAGSAPALPACDYATCTGGPLEVNFNGADCWMGTGAALMIPRNKMRSPVLAVQRNPGTDDFKFSWIYEDSAAVGNPPVNPATTTYKLQYAEFPVPTADFDPSTMVEGTDWLPIPIGAAASETLITDKFLNEVSVTVAASSAVPVVFRILVKRAHGRFPAKYVIGPYYLLNRPAAATNFRNTYDAITCDTYVGNYID